MAKKEYIARLMYIVTKLRKHPSSFEEIMNYLKTQGDIDGYDYTISKRTFQRELSEIRSIFGIDIQFDKFSMVYKIIDDPDSDLKTRISEAYDIFNALNLTERISGHIIFEKRKPHGTENLHGILHAIKNKVELVFTYRKFWNGKAEKRTVQPYALKEFRSRWYLISKDTNDNNVKSFGLDRISELVISTKRFKPDDKYDVNEQFRYSFGIIGSCGKKPEEVILSFTPIQGEYIKTLPLHETQEILIDNDEEFRIKLKVYITLDFIMEILSHGSFVKVVSPGSLEKEIKSTLKSTLEKY